MLKKIIIGLIITALLIILTGIYKFNYLSNQKGYGVDGNKITNEETVVLEEELNDLTNHVHTEVTHSHSENIEEEIEKTSLLHETNYSYGNASIVVDEQYRYITSNGLPDHETGPFPTRGNPNAISEQEHSYRTLLNPIKTNTSTEVRIAGVALNGVPFEPNTAETYDANDSWAIEAFDANGIGGLGIDYSNAHVQPNGTYHYHAVPEGMLENIFKDQSGDLLHVGWAADGFPIYHSQLNKYKPSWQIKEGSRPSTGPAGDYDGTYTQDFEFISYSGNLDQCNGTFINNQYLYILTDSFPYVGRCVYGKPDQSFDRKLQDNRGLPGTNNPNLQTASNQSSSELEKSAPAAAIQACKNLAKSSGCTIENSGKNISGVCKISPNQNNLICVPS